MKKIMMFMLIFLLGSFITNTASDSKAELYPNLNSPVTQNAKANDFKTSVVVPDKTGLVNKGEIMDKAASLAVPFVKNAGQFNAEVQYATNLFSGRFFLTDKELVYSLFKHSGKNNTQLDKYRRNAEPAKNMPEKGLAFKEYFVDKKGTKIDFKPTGEEKGTTKISYFRGNDPAKWQSGLASYKRVSLGQVYPGIEVKLKASGKNMEKIFYVSPQSNVAQIKIGVAGVPGLKIAQDGRLLFKNALGELAMRKPIAWQEIEGRRHEVKVSYRLLGKHLYGFAVLDDYNKNYTIVIDPDLDILMASTFLGGSGYDYSHSLVLDSAGNVYVTGSTSSVDFPTTFGAFDQSHNGGNDIFNGGNDIFISKLDSNLTTLLASTYLGGSSNDYAYFLTLDSSGNVYLTGATNSSDFPTTIGAYDRTYNGLYHSDCDYEGCRYWYDLDIFISKLDSNLTTLLASTYLGGSDTELVSSLALDSSGNVYLTGVTWSADFPTPPGAYDQSYSNHSDTFVSKLDRNLTTLLASTYLGGSSDEYSNSLALDSSSNVYLTGYTNSANYPTTPGAYDRTLNVGSFIYGDAFISKLDSNLTTLLTSTFLGGSSGGDGGSSLALDSSGNVYLTGGTSSADFPTTTGAFDRTYNDYEAFVSKLDGNLTTLLASTFLGGSGVDRGSSLALDSSGNVILTGATQSTDFPTTTGAYDRTLNVGSYNYGDAFVSMLNNNLTKLLASTYLGGSSSDYAYPLALDSSSNVYVTGFTSSADFPTTPGAYNRTYNGGKYGDVFVSKLNCSFIKIKVTSPKGGENWVAGTIHNITWASMVTIANVRIEVSIDNGSSWSDVIASTANTGSYSWLIPNTPSSQCLVRINDVTNTAISDTSAVFSIFISIDLLAERREVKTFSIKRQYGQIQFLVGTPSAQVAQYRIMRRQGSGDFVLIRTMTPSELQNNQFQMQDKYLTKDTTYSYRVEAYNAAEQLIGISPAKTI